MTKKPVFRIVMVVAAVLIVALAVWGKQYYEDRYVGSDYYTMVPFDYDTTPETIYSMSGEDVGLGVKYKLTAYNDQGEAKTVEFTVMEDRGNKPQQGTYLLIEASKQIVVGWSVIEEKIIPDKAMEKIIK